MSSNQPTQFRDIQVFTENPFTRVIELLDDVVIVSPVTVELWYDGVNQTGVTITPTVVDRTITFTLSVAQLRALPAKNASYNVKFGTEYVIQQFLIPTKKGSVPAEVTTSYTDSTLGVFRVSTYTGASAAATATAALSQVEAFRDEILADTVQLSDRVPGFLDDISEKLLVGRDTDYISVAGAISASGGSNGGSVNTGTKEITITASNSGSGTYERQAYNHSVFDQERVGDKINVEFKVTETVAGSISSTVLGVRIYRNGAVLSSATSTAPAVYDSATNTLRITASYLNDQPTDTYEAEIYIKSGAPTQSAETKIKWISLGIIQEKYQFKQANDLIKEAVDWAEKIKVIYDDMPVYSQIDMSGVNDVTTDLQSEINQAISTSGVWIARPGTPRITSNILVQGKVDIRLNGMDTTLDIPVAGREYFTIATASPVKITGGIARRANPSYTPTFVRFSAAYVNKDSVFEDIELYNIPSGMNIDYVDGLTFKRVKFGGGQFYGAQVGYNAPSLTTNVKFYQCEFNSYLDKACGTRSLNGFVFDECRVYASGTTYANHCLDLVPTTGALANARITRNRFEVFREYGIYVSVGTGVSVADLEISGNFFYDKTPDVTDASSRSIHIVGTSKNISLLNILDNKIYTKELGIRVHDATGVKCRGNSIFKQPGGGSYTSSQGILMSSVDYALGGNIIDPTLAVATTPGSWTSATAYTTI